MSNQYEMEGTVKVVFDTQTFASGFQKREFVITTEDKYPQDIKFEVLKEKCETLNNLKVNSKVKVLFDIRGNEYKERFFVNLNAWKVETLSQAKESTDQVPDDVYDSNADSYVDPGEESPF